MVGTYGYIAPEYLINGQCTIKTDCYAFGVVMLELLTGAVSMDQDRPGGAVHIVDWLKGRLADPTTLQLVLDPAIRGNVPSEQVQLFTSVAALCLQANPVIR